MRPHCRSYCLRAHHQVDCFIRTDIIEDNKSRDDNTSARISNSKVEPRLIGIESKGFSGFCESSRDLSCQGLYKCIITSVPIAAIGFTVEVSYFQRSIVLLHLVLPTELVSGQGISWYLICTKTCCRQYPSTVLLMCCVKSQLF